MPEMSENKGVPSSKAHFLSIFGIPQLLVDFFLTHLENPANLYLFFNGAERKTLLVLLN